MAGAAAIAAALTDHSAHPWGLYIDGFDVIKEHATPSRFGVPIDSIRIVEAGPGAISSMEFDLDDPQGVVAFDFGAEIQYWDFTRNVPMFGGYIDSIETFPDFGQQGRTIRIRCSGFESLLDTIIIDNLQINFATAVADATSSNVPQNFHILQLFCGYGPLNANAPFGTNPSQVNPVSLLAGRIAAAATTVDFSGNSIRQAWEFWLLNSIKATPNPPYAPPAGWISEAIDESQGIPFLTVDFYKGVRYHYWMGAYDNGFTGSFGWTDYTTLVLTDTPGGTPASSLDYQLDNSPAAITNAVYVKGGNAAGTGWVGTGGRPRREAYVNNPASTSVEAKRASAYTVLGQKQFPAGRGSLTLEAYTPVNGIHPGSPLTVTDARMGWASKGFVITQIEKTMNAGGSQDWTIQFQDPTYLTGSAGGPPSAARLMRTLTRGTN